MIVLLLSPNEFKNNNNKPAAVWVSVLDWKVHRSRPIYRERQGEFQGRTSSWRSTSGLFNGITLSKYFNKSTRTAATVKQTLDTWSCLDFYLHSISMSSADSMSSAHWTQCVMSIQICSSFMSQLNTLSNTTWFSSLCYKWFCLHPCFCAFEPN